MSKNDAEFDNPIRQSDIDFFADLSVVAINPKTDQEMTIEEQRAIEDKYPSGPAKELMKKAREKRVSRSREQVASENHDLGLGLVTCEELAIERAVHEEARQSKLDEQKGTMVLLSLEAYADPNINVFGYSLERCQELGHLAAVLQSLVNPEDAADFLVAVMATQDAEDQAAEARSVQLREEKRGEAKCDHCGKPGAQKKCAGCNNDSRARYCGETCQRKAWKNHKEMCPRIEKKKKKKKKIRGYFSDR